MTVNIISKNEFNELISKLSSLEEKIDNISKQSASKQWLDIDEACQILKVSKRTLQNYRDTGIISFSQIGAKIYFKASDINKHLENHYIKSFNTK